MQAEDILKFLEKGETDEELSLLIQAAVGDMGAEGFMNAIMPAADDALSWYEDHVDQLINAHTNLTKKISTRTVRIGALAGMILESDLERMDIATAMAILIDRAVAGA